MSSGGPRRPSRGIAPTWSRCCVPSGVPCFVSGPFDGRRLELGKPGSLVDPGRRGSGGVGVGFGSPKLAPCRDRGRQRPRLFGSLRLTRPTREPTLTRAASAFAEGWRQGQSWHGGTNRPAIRGQRCRRRPTGADVDSSMRKRPAQRDAKHRTGRAGRRVRAREPGKRASERTLMTSSWLQRPVTGPSLPSLEVLFGASSEHGWR